MYIYIIKNNLNGKRYVGKSMNSPISRIKSHLNGKGNKFIANAVKVLGIQTFSFNFEQFIGITDEKLYEIESYYISMVFDCKFPKGYNLTNGGEKSIGKRSYLWGCQAEIIDKYVNRKMSTIEIARDYDNKEGMVYRILKENNITFRNQNVKRDDVWAFQYDICYKFIEEQIEINQIAKLYDCSHTLIRRILKNNNIEFRPGYRSEIWEYEKEICDIYENNVISGKELAKQFSTNATTIFNILHANDIYVHPAGKRKSNSAK